MIPNYQWDVKCILTNKTGMGTFSAPGRYESCFFRERLLDMMAEDLGIDPVELRLKNLIPPSAMPYELGRTRPEEYSLIYDSGDYPALLRKALEMIDYEGIKGETGRLQEGKYHGGGIEATLEPRCEHLDAYEAHLAQNLGAGVQACYRGPRLYDTEETKAVVKRWVEFYKKHRAILESDVIHVRRADARDLDCVLHVNSQLHLHRGLAMVYNPLDSAIDRTVTLPLYYTGISDVARIGEQDSATGWSAPVSSATASRTSSTRSS